MPFLPDLVEFPVPRWWARSELARGKRPLLILPLGDCEAPVRLVAVPDQGPAVVKLPSGFEAYVPLAALRRRCDPHGNTPQQARDRFPVGPEVAERPAPTSEPEVDAPIPFPLRDPWWATR